MAEIISVVLSAIGVALLSYSLFAFIFVLSTQNSITFDNAALLFNFEFKNFKLDRSLRMLGLSLVILLFAQAILIFSSFGAHSDFFYYGIFTNVVGSIAIMGLVFQRKRFGISNLY